MTKWSVMETFKGKITILVTLVLTLVVFVKGDCGRPKEMPFAELSRKHVGRVTFPVGSSVTYYCHPGYVKIPGKSASLQCLPDSKWSEAEELCRPRSCGNPGELLHGWVETNGTTVGSVAIFHCNTGYNMISRAYRKCLETGLWSNTVPICESVICAPPPNSPNAVNSRMEEDADFTYLSSVTYHCTAGVLDGEASIYCTHHGNWSGPAPECIDVSCPVPRVNNAVVVSGFGTHFTYGQVLTFRCLEGFVMNGSSVLQCGRGGAWLPEKPVCKHKLDAPSPSLVPGTAGGSSVLQGAAVDEGGTTMHCPTRFLPAGKQVVTCRGGSTAGPEDTAKQASAEGLCDLVWKSMTEYWKRMNVEDKYIHLELQKLCLDIRNLHLQI